MTTRVVSPSAVVLHELRGPLGLMVTAARIAAETCDDQATVLRHVQTIERTALRLLESAEEVLSIATAERTGGDEPFDPAAVAIEAINDEAALGRPIRLTVEGACDWQAGRGNANQLVAMVHSLLNNAADHGAPGEPIDAIVSCSGAAIELRIVNRIGSTRHRGLGIGNDLVEELASRLGGQLERREDGTHYEVRFVLRSPAVLPDPGEFPVEPGPPGQPVLNAR